MSEAREATPSETVTMPFSRAWRSRQAECVSQNPEHRYVRGSRDFGRTDQPPRSGLSRTSRWRLASASRTRLAGESRHPRYGRPALSISSAFPPAGIEGARLRRRQHRSTERATTSITSAPTQNFPCGRRGSTEPSIHETSLNGKALGIVDARFSFRGRDAVATQANAAAPTGDRPADNVIGHSEAPSWRDRGERGSIGTSPQIVQPRSPVCEPRMYSRSVEGWSHGGLPLSSHWRRNAANVFACMPSPR